MKLNWTLILQYAISGAVVSWPVFLAGLWAAHRRLRRHLEEMTGEQTGELEKITEDQTAALLHRLGREYQEHGEEEDS